MAIDRKSSWHLALRAGLAMISAVPAFSLAHARESADGTRKTAQYRENWRLSIGASYSSGDYGEPIDTSVTSFPIALRYSKNRFRARLSVPYVILSGPGSLLDPGDSGGVDVGDGDLRFQRRQGIGDVSVSAGYLLPLGHRLSLDATGRVKLPTASRAKRLGTGKVDFVAGLELRKTLKGASLYVGGRRRFVGEPDGANLRDVWGVGAGGSANVAKGLNLGLNYSWRQSSRIGGGDISEVVGWTNVRLNRRLRLTIYGGTGLTQNSSDRIAGTSLSYRL